MKFNETFMIFFLLSIYSLLAVQSSIAQEKMTEPADFFENFPEIEWGMSVEKAKEAIEKTGNRAARPVETRLNWVATFDGREGLGIFLFSEEGKLEAVIVQPHYSEQGKRLYESWSKKMTNKHGEAKEESLSDDVTARRWNFKNGFFVEIRLVKGEGENRYMADIHWERIQQEK